MLLVSIREIGDSELGMARRLTSAYCGVADNNKSDIVHKLEVRMSDMGSMLGPNGLLHKDDYLLSPLGRYQFILQEDGNLVLYDLGENHRAIWASNTNGQAVSKAIMQSDGNLVIYGFPNAIWASNTNGQASSILSAQDDGNVVIYHFGTPVWATNTDGQ
jgi:hypothetical protein